MTHFLFLLNFFVLCIINLHSPLWTLEPDILCYEQIRGPKFEIALKWNSKFSAPPYYLNLKVVTRVGTLKSSTIKTEMFYYHLKLTLRVCDHTMKFVRYRPDITSLDVDIDFMTNYDGITLTRLSLDMGFHSSFDTHKVPDPYSMLELYIDFEKYNANREVKSILQGFPRFPINFITSFVEERAPLYKYVCASANNRLVILNLVSNFDGPAVGYFGSISVVIFRNKQYVHSETWNAWPCPSWNTFSSMSPTLVIEGSTDDVEVVFRKNKIGEPDSISHNIDYTTFVSSHTFSCPSLQITALSTIASPLSELTPIYAVKSNLVLARCRVDFQYEVISTRQTSSDSTQVQKYLMKYKKVGDVNVGEYTPLKEDLCE